jgi:hypothetical protein
MKESVRTKLMALYHRILHKYAYLPDKQQQALNRQKI